MVRGTKISLSSGEGTELGTVTVRRCLRSATVISDDEGFAWALLTEQHRNRVAEGLKVTNLAGSSGGGLPVPSGRQAGEILAVKVAGVTTEP